MAISALTIQDRTIKVLLLFHASFPHLRLTLWIIFPPTRLPSRSLIPIHNHQYMRYLRRVSKANLCSRRIQIPRHLLRGTSLLESPPFGVDPRKFPWPHLQRDINHRQRDSLLRPTSVPVDVFHHQLFDYFLSCSRISSTVPGTLEVFLEIYSKNTFGPHPLS